MTVSFENQNLIENTPKIKKNNNNKIREVLISQPTFTCSKSTIETLEYNVKYVQVNNKDTGMTLMGSNVSIVDFEQVFLVGSSLTNEYTE